MWPDGYVERDNESAPFLSYGHPSPVPWAGKKYAILYSLAPDTGERDGVRGQTGIWESVLEKFVDRRVCL